MSTSPKPDRSLLIPFIVVVLDLITAQQDESNARVQRIQSYLDWFTALARLNFSIGVNNILAATDNKK